MYYDIVSGFDLSCTSLILQTLPRRRSVVVVLVPRSGKHQAEGGGRRKLRCSLRTATIFPFRYPLRTAADFRFPRSSPGWSVSVYTTRRLRPRVSCGSARRRRRPIAYPCKHLFFAAASRGWAGFVRAYDRLRARARPRVGARRDCMAAARSLGAYSIRRLPDAATPRL